jgi:hypothetical protein
VDASEREDVPQQAPPPEKGSSPEQDSLREQASSASASRVKGQTVWVTKVGQIIGLVIGANQGLLEEHPRRDLVMLAVFLVLGAQGVENLLFRAIDRFFDRVSD